MPPKETEDHGPFHREDMAMTQKILPRRPLEQELGQQVARLKIIQEEEKYWQDDISKSMKSATSTPQQNLQKYLNNQASAGLKKVPSFG